MSEPHGVGLSLILPVYNEAERLERHIERVLAHARALQSGALEVVIVDDASQDGSLDVALKLERAHHEVRLLAQPSNRGKGAAVKQGMLSSVGRHVLFMDADLSYPLELIERACERLDSGAEVVLGARDLLYERGWRAYPLKRRVTTQLFRALVERALALGVPDTQCGFKAFDGELARELFAQVQVERFGFDVEVIYLCRLWGVKIERLPAQMAHDAHRVSSVRVVRDSLSMISDVARVWLRAARGDYPPERSRPRRDVRR